jgi:hypothetical protein
MTYQASGTNGVSHDLQCKVMLCRARTTLAVRLDVYLADQLVSRHVPACDGCAIELAELLRRGRQPAMTPDGAIYPQDLAELRRPYR